jgi:hypothetical protein
MLVVDIELNYFINLQTTFKISLVVGKGQTRNISFFSFQNSYLCQKTHDAIINDWFWKNEWSIWSQKGFY